VYKQIRTCYRPHMGARHVAVVRNPGSPEMNVTALGFKARFARVVGSASVRDRTSTVPLANLRWKTALRSGGIGAGAVRATEGRGLSAHSHRPS